MPDDDSPISEVLNPLSLEQLRALDPAQGDAFVRRVLQTYLQALDRQKDALAVAEGAQDAKSVGAAAHALKSASASVGAAAMAARCAEVEQKALGGWSVTLAEALGEMNETAVRTRTAVARELGLP